MKKVQVSIIVLNYNQLDLTKNCLNSLKMIGFEDFQVIIVDNGSKDGSPKYLRNFVNSNPKFKLIELSDNTGYVGGNNIGYSEAIGKYVLILNNDTVVDSKFISPLVRRMEKDKKIAVLQSKLLLMEKPKYLDNVSTKINMFGFLSYEGYLKEDKGQYDKYLDIFSAKGASMMIRRSAIDGVPFDKDYFAYFEETDLCWRMWLKGYKVGFEPKSVVYHKMGATSAKSKSSFIQFHSFKNRIRTILKNASTLTLLWMIPLHAGVICVFISYLFVTKRAEVAVGVIKAMRWNVRNFIDTMEMRSIVQKTRKISDRDLFRKNMYNPSPFAHLRHMLLLEKSIK